MQWQHGSQAWGVSDSRATSVNAEGSKRFFFSFEFFQHCQWLFLNTQSPSNFVIMSCVWHLGLLAVLFLSPPFNALGQVAPCGHQCWEEHRHHHSRLQEETDQTSSQEWARLHWHQWHHRVWHQVPGRRCFPGKAVSVVDCTTLVILHIAASVRLKSSWVSAWPAHCYPEGLWSSEKPG